MSGSWCSEQPAYTLRQSQRSLLLQVLPDNVHDEAGLSREPLILHNVPELPEKGPRKVNRDSLGFTAQCINTLKKGWGRFYNSFSLRIRPVSHVRQGGAEPGLPEGYEGFVGLEEVRRPVGVVVSWAHDLEELALDEPLEVALHDLEVQIRAVNDLGLQGASPVPGHTKYVCLDVQVISSPCIFHGEE